MSVAGILLLIPYHLSYKSSNELNLDENLNQSQIIYPEKLTITFAVIYKHPSIYHCTENHIFFFQTPWKMVFSKKLRCNMIFLILSGKMIFIFPENMILPLGRKMKDDLSQKMHGNMTFSSNVLKRWSFQKGLGWDIIFLALSGKMVLFSQKHDIFSLGGKRGAIFFKKYMEIWGLRAYSYIALHRKKNRKFNI